MFPQLQYHTDSFFPDFFSKLVILRISCSGQGKILPHHDPVLIAPVEKVVVFVNIAAPAADHVAIQVGYHCQGTFEVLFVAAVKSIQRHPVGSLYKNFFTIDFKNKLAGIFGSGYFCPDQISRADSHILTDFIQYFPAVVSNPEGGVIQGRFAITAGPPEIHVIQLNALAAAMTIQGERIFINSLPQTFERNFHCQPVDGWVVGRKLPVEQHFSCFLLHIHAVGHPVHLLETGCFFNFEGNAPPQPGANQPRQNIPAIHVGRFTNMFLLHPQKFT